MAGNIVFPKYKEALLNATANVKLNDTTTANVAPFLIMSTSSWNAAGTETFANAVTNQVGPNAGIQISTPTIVNGFFTTVGSVLFPLVSGTTFPTPAARISIYVNNANVLGNSRLVIFEDTGVLGFPVQANGGDITITFPTGICQF